MRLLAVVTFVVLAASDLCFGLSIPAPKAMTRSTPPQCFDICNLGRIEIQTVGDPAILCAPGSAFLTDKEDCFICNAANGGDDSDFPDVNAMCG